MNKLDAFKKGLVRKEIAVRIQKPFFEIVIWTWRKSTRNIPLESSTNISLFLYSSGTDDMQERDGPWASELSCLLHKNNHSGVNCAVSPICERLENNKSRLSTFMHEN